MLENEIKEIQEFASQFEIFEQNPEEVYKEVNQLSRDKVNNLYETYKSIVDRFKPVNLLRLEILSKLKNGEIINDQVVEDLKEKIRNKDTSYFQDYGTTIVQGLSQYQKGTRDTFANWQNPFFIFHTFFFDKVKKDKITTYLNQIADRIKEELTLGNEYKTHIVDFQGPQYFGQNRCWIAIFPRVKVSHRKAYQLFIAINGNTMEAGVVPGWDIKDNESRDVEDCANLDEVVSKLSKLKEKVEEKNNSVINFWKIAPGANAILWDDFINNGIMAIGWDELGDLTQYTEEEVGDLLGITNTGNSNNIFSIKNFLDASVGDVVVASKGKRKSLGIGIIDSEYRYDQSRDEYRHIRDVNWIIKEEVDYGKTIFRPDAFSPTLKWDLIKETYKNLNPNYSQKLQDIESGKEIIDNSKLPTYQNIDQDYWWLNANPKIWSIQKQEIGDIQLYTSHNEKNNKRRIYKYFEEIKPGDLIIGYESSPVKQVVAILECTEGLHIDENEGEGISFMIKEFIDSPLTWDEIQEINELQQSEILKNNQGSLFKLNPEEFDALRYFIDEKTIGLYKETKNKMPYDYRKDPDEVFLEDNEFNKIMNLLSNKKNIILQGAPGVGKTFIAKKIAFQKLGMKDSTKVEMVQFHQSYSYEDFIQGIRPDKNGFKIKPGVFYKFVQKAISNPNSDYFFIIDEINRGNLSKIFGELMMLLENDKRGEKWEVSLTYSEGEKFFIPKNVYIIGTMNTADRSLAIVDYALRRRFVFYTLIPVFNEIFVRFLTEKGVPEYKVRDIVDRINALNTIISNDNDLGRGFQIGHSFFCTYNNEQQFEEWYSNVIDYEIEPLLSEYWFDKPEKVKEEKNKLAK